jgi:hypothetical protein
MGGRPSPESKFNGMHGPKHKRGEIDRECEQDVAAPVCASLMRLLLDNRFAGTRIEDLVGEISSLCKDQHGCRYLQKKLEEGSPEHRDMIFRETFSQFADLMTGTVSLRRHADMRLMVVSQTRSATTSARSSSSSLRMNSATSSASPSRPTWSTSPSTCTARAPFRR